MIMMGESIRQIWVNLHGWLTWRRAPKEVVEIRSNGNFEIVPKITRNRSQCYRNDDPFEDLSMITAKNDGRN